MVILPESRVLRPLDLGGPASQDGPSVGAPPAPTEAILSGTRPSRAETPDSWETDQVVPFPTSFSSLRPRSLDWVGSPAEEAKLPLVEATRLQPRLPASV